MTFAANPVAMTLTAGVTYTFGFYSSVAIVPPLATPSPKPTPTPTPSPAPTPSPTPTPSGAPLPGPGTPLAGPSVGPNNGWGPVSVANALNFPVQSGFNGAGSTVAIVNDSNVLSSDLAQYQAYFQIPSTGRTVTVQAVDGASTTPGANGDSTEATLDLEAIAGLAPGANILVYVIPALSSQYYNDAFNQIVSDGRSNIVSLSFAGCEGASSLGTSAIIANAVQAGIAIVSSSGDQGSTCFSGTSSGGTPQYAVGVGYPASDPNVIGVGGTETNVSLLSTTAWNDNFSTAGQLASGGGVSTTFTLPPYQNGLAGAASAQFRNVPDIAMPAVFTALYLNGQWQLENGTSWASPEFAAMLSEVSQYCKTSLTNPAAIPYSVYANGGSSAFLDVVSGNNAIPLSGGTSYSAHAGYDNVTGLGVPIGMPFARTLCPNRVPSSFARGVLTSTRVATGSSTARTLDVAPKVRGLADLGRRSAIAQTRIQLVLLPAPSLGASEQTVTGILQSAGFRIERTFANHLVVDADGSSAAVEQLFGTQLHDVAQGRYGTRYMPTTPITIPASLTQYVADVTLDDVVNMANPNGR
jgi:subtilase family serine protease